MKYEKIEWYIRKKSAGEALRRVLRPHSFRTGQFVGYQVAASASNSSAFMEKYEVRQDL